MNSKRVMVLDQGKFLLNSWGSIGIGGRRGDVGRGEEEVCIVNEG